MTFRSLSLLCVVGAFSASSCSDSDIMVRERVSNCGNGSTEMGEACDDGNDINTDACTNSCDVAFCGDGVTRSDLSIDDMDFEACDDGNIEDSDGCLNG